MTKFSRAALTTSLVTVCRSLISRMRSNLGKQPLQQAEVAIGHANDGCNRLDICKVRLVHGEAEVRPFLLEQEAQFCFAQGPELMHKADARVQLGVAR